MVSTIQLQPAELSYLLQTVRVSSVLGVDNSELFPRDEDKNNSLLEAGLNKLLEHGWMTRDAETGKVNFNASLSYLISVMADPDCAILTMRQDAIGDTQLISHYLVSDLIVEQVRTREGSYELAFVAGLTTAVERIESVIRPIAVSKRQTSGRFSLTKDIYARMKAHVRAGAIDAAGSDLRENNVSAPLAASLVRAVQRPEHKAMIIVVKNARSDDRSTRSLTVLQGHEESWLLRAEGLDDPVLHLETFWPQLFIHYLSGYLQTATQNSAV